MVAKLLVEWHDVHVAGAMQHARDIHAEAARRDEEQQLKMDAAAQILVHG